MKNLFQSVLFSYLLVFVGFWNWTWLTTTKPAHSSKEFLTDIFAYFFSLAFGFGGYIQKSLGNDAGELSNYAPTSWIWAAVLISAIPIYILIQWRKARGAHFAAIILALIFLVPIVEWLRIKK